MSNPKPQGLEERRAADGKFGSGRSAADDDTAADRVSAMDEGALDYDASDEIAAIEQARRAQYLQTTTTDMSDYGEDELPSFQGNDWWKELDYGDEVRVESSEESWLITGRSGDDPELGPMIELRQSRTSNIIIVPVSEIS